MTPLRVAIPLILALTLPVRAQGYVTEGPAQDVPAQPAPQATATEDYDGTISWYMRHPAERKTTIQRCDNDPGHLQNAPDCINAKKADNQAGVDNFKQGVDNTIQGAADFFHKF